MSTTWIANAYAKINLGLHIKERLPTGYHSLETGFCFLEWNDRFTIKEADSTTLEIPDTDIPVDDRNLIMKALNILRSYGNLLGNYHITVDKKIPVGAGLGGGSSNAALTFRMLNKIENLGLNENQLVELSRDIGADVAFFLDDNTGMGSGLGNTITPLDIQPDLWILTVYPNFESSTAEAYAHCDPNVEHEIPLEKILTSYVPDEWRYMLDNDLELAVIPKYKMIGDIRDQLYEFGATYAAMSGSGSSVFGLFEQDFVALDAYKAFLELQFATNLTKPQFKPDYGIYRKD